MGGKSSAPSAPNPAQTAGAQQALNQVNQYSPLGSSVYTPTGQSIDGVPTYNNTTTLSPQMQQLFNQQISNQTGLAGGEQSLVGKVDSSAGTSNPFGLQGNAGVSSGQLSNMFNQQQNAAYESQMGYLQPQFQQQTGQLQDQLAQQGITEASNPTAYANSMKLMNDQQTFQGQQAYNNSYQTGLQGMQSLFGMGATNANLNNSANQQYLGDQTTQINQLNALLGTTQAQMPSFSSNGQNSNYMNAVQNQYNSQLASYNNQQSGLFGLGSAGLMAYAMA